MSRSLKKDLNVHYKLEKSFKLMQAASKSKLLKLIQELQ